MMCEVITCNDVDSEDVYPTLLYSNHCLINFYCQNQSIAMSMHAIIKYLAI